jgi:CheY-like chemotaxis protein
MNKRQALIVEDESDLADIFAEALQAAGFETEIAGTGPLALECLASSEPDLILLDLHLPGLDGGYVLQQIRTDPRLQKSRVMLATADAMFARTLEQDADFVLLKPISFSQLRDLTQRLNRP